MTLTLNGTSGVTTPGIANSEGYSGDGLTIAAGAPAGAMTLDASGNLGVGTSSPAQKLHVYGNVRIGNPGHTYMNVDRYSDSYESLYYLNSPSLSSTKPSWRWGYDSVLGTGVYSWSLSSYDGTTVIPRLVVDKIGSLLIGTTSSGGSGTYRGLTICGNGDTSLGPSTYYAGIYYKFNSMYENGLVFDGQRNTNGQNTIIFQNVGSTVGSITINTASVSFNSTSDYRLKENVLPMQNALEKVMKINPVTFTWKSNGSADRGFIAHELQEIIPQAVNGEKDELDFGGNIKPQGVDYGKITPEIVAAIQEQQAMITELKARIEQLETK